MMGSFGNRSSEWRARSLRPPMHAMRQAAGARFSRLSTRLAGPRPPRTTPQRGGKDPRACSGNPAQTPGFSYNRAVNDLKWDDAGLITAVVQDRLTGQVRMVAWMNREALDATLSSGFATFYSRSRRALWRKGETSGHVLRVFEVAVDCDGDTLLVLVDPEGPSCHTGRATCFFRRLDMTQGASESSASSAPSHAPSAGFAPSDPSTADVAD